MGFPNTRFPTHPLVLKQQNTKWAKPAGTHFPQWQQTQICLLPTTPHSPNKQTQLSLKTHKQKKKTEQTTTRSTIRLYLLVFKTDLEHDSKECQHFPITHYSQLLQITDQFSILYWKPKRKCSLQMHMRRRHIAYPPYGHSHTRSHARRPRKWPGVGHQWQAWCRSLVIRLRVCVCVRAFYILFFGLVR